MSLSSLFTGTPNTYGVGVTASMRPPMFSFAKALGQYLQSLIGQPMPQYPGQLDPGMSPTMQMLGKMAQQYAGSGAPPIMGAAANSLNRFMNPSFTNPVARIGGGSPGYAPVNMGQSMWGGAPTSSLYDQFQLPPSYQLPQAPGGDYGYMLNKGGQQGGFDPNQPFVGGNMAPYMGGSIGQTGFGRNINDTNNSPVPYSPGGYNSPNVGVPYNGGGGAGGNGWNPPPGSGQAGYGAYPSGGMGGAMQPQYPSKPGPSYSPQGSNGGWVGMANPGNSAPWTPQMMQNATPMAKPVGNYGW